jgi:hypothetical protein
VVCTEFLSNKCNWFAKPATIKSACIIDGYAQPENNGIKIVHILPIQCAASQTDALFLSSSCDRLDQLPEKSVWWLIYPAGG